MSNPAQNPAQAAAARLTRFQAWKNRRATLVDELNDACARLAGLRAPGAVRMADPTRETFTANQETREQEAVASLEAHDKAGREQYADLIDAPAASVRDPRDQIIENLQSVNASLGARLAKCRCGASAGQ